MMQLWYRGREVEPELEPARHPELLQSFGAAPVAAFGGSLPRTGGLCGVRGRHRDPLICGEEKERSEYELTSVQSTNPLPITMTKQPKQRLTLPQQR